MFDKYFCKRLHAKEITLCMIMNYIRDTSIYGECLCIYSIFAASALIIEIATYGFIATLLPVCLGVIVVGIALLFVDVITPKIKVASCPLTKTGGKL